MTFMECAPCPAKSGLMLFPFILLMPFTLLSGLTTPIENMPKVLQYFTLVNPLRYAIDIIHRIYLEGVGLGTLAAASWMFRNRLA
jgi:ABC-2 type transport system permease protein